MVNVIGKIWYPLNLFVLKAFISVERGKSGKRIKEQLINRCSVTFWYILKAATLTHPWSVGWGY